MRQQTRKFTVSGPGANDKKTCPSEGAGLSYCFTLASRHAYACKAAGEPQEGTWYVRNEDGETETYVELFEDGRIASR